MIKRFAQASLSIPRVELKNWDTTKREKRFDNFVHVSINITQLREKIIWNSKMSSSCCRKDPTEPNFDYIFSLQQKVWKNTATTFHAQ